MDKCACKGFYLERFIQPSIMLLLLKEPMHGFSMLKALKQSTVMDYSNLDPTGLYRMLKKMEDTGLLSSRIDAENALRGKRVYSITERGRTCLYYWKLTLNDYKRRIGELADVIPDELRKGMLTHL